MTLRELGGKDVIQLKNGENLGRIDDLAFDENGGRLQSVILRGRAHCFGLLGCDDVLVLPWESIRSIGLYKNKARNLLAMSRILLEEHGGKVPESLEELVRLPGVGRKTANVVLSNAFEVPAIAVDTHVFRVSNRLGLADAGDVAETERQLMQVIEKEDWSKMHHCIIFHGRRVCKARKPLCESCTIRDLCKYHKKLSKESQ